MTGQKRPSPEHKVLWLGVLAEKARDNCSPPLRSAVCVLVLFVRPFVGVRDQLKTQHNTSQQANKNTCRDERVVYFMLACTKTRATYVPTHRVLLATATKQHKRIKFSIVRRLPLTPHLLLLHSRRVPTLLLLFKLQPSFSILLVSEGLQLIPGKRHPNRHLLRRRRPRRKKRESETRIAIGSVSTNNASLRVSEANRQRARETLR